MPATVQRLDCIFSGLHIVGAGGAVGNINIENGEELFNVPFKNGNSYASCFENDGIGIRQNYPFFDEDMNQVMTLELAINDCRKKI